jgi:hypothetical protein
MKYFLFLLIGLLAGLGGSAAWATLMMGTVQLTATDANGHTQHATAQLVSLSYDGEGPNTVLAVSYTTDELFCSAFGSGP